MGWFLIVASSASLIIAFYLGFRTISLFNCHQQGYFNTTAKKLFWLIVIFGALSFILSRILSGISEFYLPLLGNLIFSLTLCFFYSIIVIDIIRFILRVIIKKQGNPGYRLQILYIILAVGLFIIGLYLASAPRIVTYQIDIDKPAKVDNVKIVQLSDIHISETTSPHFIQTMVNSVNQLKPDYIVITGDTLDLRLKPYVDKHLAEIFAQLHATYGTFIIFGNHEHYGIEREANNSLQDVVAAFEASNMTVLLDQRFYDDRTGITIIGRDDYALKKFNKNRAELSSLIEPSDANHPIILLDHQPQNLNEPSQLGIDVMFSGHTHAGQIFPINLLVNMLYKNAWGIYQLGHNGRYFTSFVTSGYGLWGPPIRLMTRAEIVVTDIHFNSSEMKP
ncbi:hypothetical protein DES39_0716 [Orbus hercynius]|uniref:Calcineurin-like phosphoesterase domain-containing protein n=1 Tax=Orbus hercynius TaxID=593135 RepID=A0A495RIX5_9GAMM|nr:metallophosphoesterase [Orbus hercynius]RKS87482.1 hypothetical protein DES39_0716 [Orbus hercynius]